MTPADCKELVRLAQMLAGAVAGFFSYYIFTAVWILGGEWRARRRARKRGLHA